MRVWVVGRGIPSKKNGMLGSFEFEQAKILAKKGVEVVYFGISVRSAHNLANQGFSHMKLEGIAVESFNFPLGRLLSSEKTDAVFSYAFRKLAGNAIKKFGFPDIVHVHYPAQRPYTVLRELQESGAKVVATEHWTAVQERKLKGNCLQNLKDFCENCDAFICVGSVLRNSVLALTGTARTISVIPNVVDDHFSILPSEGKGVRFLASGRLVRHKQFDKVVQAFIETFHDVQDAFLTVAGGGDEFSHIQKLVASSGMENRIMLTGTVARSEMAKLMAESSILVSYSRLETFCVPVIEAWMCGKPTIVSSVTPVVIDHPDERLGLLTDCNDLGSLKRAMLYMYHHCAEYDAAWISRYAKEHFGEEAIAGNLLKTYESIIG